MCYNSCYSSCIYNWYQSGHPFNCITGETLGKKWKTIMNVFPLQGWFWMRPTIGCVSQWWGQPFEVSMPWHGSQSFQDGLSQRSREKDGVESNKPEEDWTETELKLAKFNSRVMSVIHASVTKKNFELIQGCETAKEA